LKAIRGRKCFFATCTALGTVITVVLIVCGAFMPKIHIHTLLPLIIAANMFTAYLWLIEYRKLKMAQLIVENHILHIRPAVISGSDDQESQGEDADNIEVFVSYFGILLDTRVIKFNQAGIRLQGVEIGHDFVSLTYGTEKRVQSTRLLRPPFDAAELGGIVERFRYETGIAPVIVKQ